MQGRELAAELSKLSVWKLIRANCSCACSCRLIAPILLPIGGAAMKPKSFAKTNMLIYGIIVESLIPQVFMYHLKGECLSCTLKIAIARGQEEAATARRQ